MERRVSKLHNYLRAGAVFAFCILVESAALAGSDIYRYVDENGVVTFSSSPPSSAGNVSKMNVGKPNLSTPTEVAKKKEEGKQLHKQVSSRINQRIEARKTKAEKIAAVRKEVEEKKKALEQGKVPLPGERVGTVYGYSRLRPSYINRVKALADSLAIAEKKLKDME